MFQRKKPSASSPETEILQRASFTRYHLFHIHHRRMHTSFPFNVGSRESLLSCPRILIYIPPVTELVLPSGSKATFHPRILRFPSSLRKTLSERAVYVLLFFLAFVHVNHSEGRRICQEMTVDFVPVKLMRKYY